MLIKIIDSYAFEHTKDCYILYEVGQREKGVFGKVKESSGEMVDYQDTLGYFGSVHAMLDYCLKYATRRATDAAGVKMIGDYIEIMKQIAEEIKQSVDITAF